MKEYQLRITERVMIYNKDGHELNDIALRALDSIHYHDSIITVREDSEDEARLKAYERYEQKLEGSLITAEIIQ